MPTTDVRGLNVLALYVSDLERATAFYTEHLGFERVEDMHPGVLLKAGDVTLYVEGGHGGNDGRALSGFCPCFATASVRRSHEALSAAGVRVTSPYREFAPTFAMFRVADPDGNQIEFAGAP